MLRYLMLSVTLLMTTSAMAADLEVGDSVLALWAPADAYFVGTVVEKSTTGYSIVFEDGDTATVAAAQVRKNDIKVDSKVLARWKDGSYYPGTVAKVVGRALYIHYDDGDKGWAPWSWIAVK